MSPNLRAFFLKLLAARFGGRHQDKWVRLLPESQAKFFLDAPLPPHKAQEGLQSYISAPSEVLPLIHYSWYCTYLASHAPLTRQIWIACLPENLREKVADHFGLPKNLKKPLRPVRKRLERYLFDALKPQHIPLPGLLPDSSLKILFDLKKRDLVSLIDLLGVLDLRETLRKLVDKTIIQEIFDALSPLQQRFLKKIYRHREKLVVKDVPWRECRKDPLKLKQILHSRGLVRLGGALESEEEGFVWYLLHRLDTGRAKIIKKIWDETSARRRFSPTREMILKQDIKEACAFLGYKVTL